MPTIRPVTRADLPAFHAVMMAAGIDSRSSWNRTTVQDLEGSLFADGAGGFVALDGGGEASSAGIIGCVGFRPDGQGNLTLNKLATLPQVRGQGLGQALVSEVEHHAQRQGFRRVLLAVSQFNVEVIPFYQKLGYVQTDDVYAFANPTSPKPVVMVKEMIGDGGLFNHIERIKKKLELVFNSKNYDRLDAHQKRQILYPPISEKELEDVQQKCGIIFPEGYRLFLTKIANGGFGPYYGVFPLQKSLEWARMCDLTKPFPLIALVNGEDCTIIEALSGNEVDVKKYFYDEEDEEDDSPFYPHLVGSWIVADEGCGYSTTLIVNGTEYGQIWHDYEAADCGVHPELKYGKSGGDFLSWYESWLDSIIKRLGVEN